VRRLPGHHQENKVQLELPLGLLREKQMTDVGRVEGSAEDPDTSDRTTP
jgi:hypothetical protein